MTIQTTAKRLLSASVLMAALSGMSVPALALDADDFATKVAAVASMGGGKVSFEAIEPDGDTIVLKSTRFETPGQPPVEVGDVTFNGVEENGDGSYHVDQAQFADVDMAQGPVKISIADMEASGLTIPAEPVYDTLDGIMFYESFSTGKINVERDGTSVFSMSGLNLDVNRVGSDNMNVAMLMTGAGLRMDLSQIEEPKAKQALRELGYQTVTGDLKLDAVWDMGPGTLNIRDYALTLDDIGRLAMSLSFSGYNLEFIKAMQQAQAAASANPDPKAAQQAMGFAMMGMLQQLSFNSASIRFDDASVTQRALAYAGKQQGMSGEQLGQSMKFLVPMMLGQLGIPALQQQIAAAANIYLDNPQSFMVTAKPAEPVAVPMIMGAGMGDPRLLVDLLNVQVTANTPR